MSTISFEEAKKILDVGVSDGLEQSEIIPEVDLLWQTAIVNIQKGAPVGPGIDEIVLLNRFFEFDAGTHQPIFKTISINYKHCLDRLKTVIDEDYLSAFTTQLLNCSTHTAVFNLTRPDGTMISTSWAIENGIVSTVIMIGDWDLWRDAPTDIIIAFIAHIAIAKRAGATPGPISFVCNRMTLHTADIPVVSRATVAFRELVRFHADIDYRLRAFADATLEVREQQPDESVESYVARCNHEEELRQQGKKALEEIEQETPLQKEMFDVYAGRYVINVEGSIPADDLRILNGIKLPEIATVTGAPESFKCGTKLRS